MLQLMKVNDNTQFIVNVKTTYFSKMLYSYFLIFSPAANHVIANSPEGGGRFCNDTI